MEKRRPVIHPSPKRKRDDYEHDSSPVPTNPSDLPQAHSATSASGNGRRSSLHMPGPSKSKDLTLARPNSAPLANSPIGKEVPLEIRGRIGDSPTDIDQKVSGIHNSTPPSRRRQKLSPPKDEHFDIEPSSPASPSPSKARTKPKESSEHEPKKRCKSPPLTAEAEEDDLTWHDWEITGHDPTDPNDDGYGINGIGFKPTAAIAWNRSQQRKKQLEEWRRRESRDARNKRREKRDGITVEDSSPTTSPSNKKKVTFIT